MSQPKEKKILLWSARFASRENEESFQDFVFRRNLVANAGGACLGLFLFIIYVFSDYIDAVNPHEVVAIRVVTFLVCSLLMSLLLFERFRQYQDAVVAVVVTLMGAAVNLIVYIQPTLENTYYIALIQGFIMFSLLLRLSFTSMFMVIAITQACFMMAAFAHAETGDAVLQSANLFMVGAISVVGVYLLQRYQRADFLKSETIRAQNTKLNILLEDAKRDNERKLAAMNMLVHFVKTPLHQINGFSDIVMNSLDGDDDRISISDGVEGARYIKNATANLSKSVNNLLTYHRLDDVDGAQRFTNSSIDDLVFDFGDTLKSEIDVKIEGTAGELSTDEAILKTAFACLANHYNSESEEISRLKISLYKEHGFAFIKLRDNGETFTQERFENETKPLTKIDNYLTSDGSEMSMSLRTVARALELCSGELTLTRHDDGNEFIITLKNVPVSIGRQTAA